jgi:hypothetical protein
MSDERGNRGLELPITVAGWFELTDFGAYCASANYETDVAPSSAASSAFEVYDDMNAVLAFGRGITQDVYGAKRGRRYERVCAVGRFEALVVSSQAPQDVRSASRRALQVHREIGEMTFFLDIDKISGMIICKSDKGTFR